MINRIKTINKKGKDEKISFKDFAALCIAAYEILIPIITIFFIVFCICFFFLIKYWMK